MAQVSALESLCGGPLDFGYLQWKEDYIDAVVAKGDWFHDLEVKESGDVWCTSSLISRLSRIETKGSRGGALRLDVGHESGGWHWEAQDPEACEALLSFTAQLRRRSEEEPQA